MTTTKQKKNANMSKAHKKQRLPVMIQHGCPLDWIWDQPRDMCLSRCVRAFPGRIS